MLPQPITAENHLPQVPTRVIGIPATMHSIHCSETSVTHCTSRDTNSTERTKVGSSSLPHCEQLRGRLWIDGYSGSFGRRACIVPGPTKAKNQSAMLEERSGRPVPTAGVDHDGECRSPHSRPCRFRCAGISCWTLTERPTVARQEIFTGPDCEGRILWPLCDEAANPAAGHARTIDQAGCRLLIAAVRVRRKRSPGPRHSTGHGSLRAADISPRSACSGSKGSSPKGRLMILSAS
ncbi:hypothetical protein ACVMB0_000381 [Bradyrhizobium sp. USDA 4451]